MKHSTPTPAARLLSIPQAAAYLAISERTAWTLVNNGRLPAVRFGRIVRIDQQDIERFILSVKGQRAAASQGGQNDNP